MKEELIRMRDLDISTRQQLLQTGELFESYHPEMEKVHVSNAKRLEEIIQEFGWPEQAKVGKEANEAAWLIAQHAISLPSFQRKCLIYMSTLAKQGLEDKIHVAYLHDRICFNERKPQKYGTQYDWDEYGQMSPWPVEDIAQANKLRKEMGLNTVEDQTIVIRQQIKDNNEKASSDYLKRQKEILEWCKKTGWIQ